MVNNMNTRRTLLRKVPEVTAIFWATKILTTAMGESTSDFMVGIISPYIAVGLGFIAFIVALVWQFRVKKYIPGIYWFTVAMVAVFGTMVADVIHVQLGVPYALSSLGFAIILTAVLMLWHNTEGTLSVHTITTPRRELFYWLTVVTTFALGTAVGDWTAASLGLGYLFSGLVFIFIITIPDIGYRLGLNEVVAFWFAYIITRPLGASFADWFGKSALDGLGFGDGTVSAVLTALIVLSVLFMTYNRREAKHEIADN